MSLARGFGFVVFGLAAVTGGGVLLAGAQQSDAFLIAAGCTESFVGLVAVFVLGLAEGYRLQR